MGSNRAAKGNTCFSISYCTDVPHVAPYVGQHQGYVQKMNYFRPGINVTMIDKKAFKELFKKKISVRVDRFTLMFESLYTKKLLKEKVIIYTHTHAKNMKIFENC